jgi:hypothetical protein
MVAIPCATPNRICDLQQIGHEIATPNRSCNQPLIGSNRAISARQKSARKSVLIISGCFSKYFDFYCSSVRFQEYPIGRLTRICSHFMGYLHCKAEITYITIYVRACPTAFLITYSVPREAANQPTASMYINTSFS